MIESLTSSPIVPNPPHYRPWPCPPYESRRVPLACWKSWHAAAKVLSALEARDARRDARDAQRYVHAWKERP